MFLKQTTISRLGKNKSFDMRIDKQNVNQHALEQNIPYPHLHQISIAHVLESRFYNGFKFVINNSRFSY